MLVFSCFILLIYSFSCINKLGSNDFPLKVTYEDLKIGAFEKIGKFIISINIPVIIASSFLSIIGLYQILIVRDLVVGFTIILIGFSATVSLAILLYRDTLHIHNAILEHKNKLKKRTIGNIQELLNNDEDDTKEIKSSKIETIHFHHRFYNEILNINDWPFNPTSIRKLAITLGSSVLPLLLSFFGIM